MELDFLSVVGVLKSLTLGSVSLAVLVVILTEVVKEFAGITGKAVRAVALGLGFVLTAISYGMSEGLIPAAAGPHIEWVFVAVVGGLGGMGLWHLGKRFLSTNMTSDGDLADAVARGLRDRGFLPPGDIANDILEEKPGTPCPMCGQIDFGEERTGEHPCPECGMPWIWDDPVPGELILTTRAQNDG